MAVRAERGMQGCWIDGRWGQYGVAKMVKIAADFGYKNAEMVRIADKHLASMEFAAVDGLTDDEYETLYDGGDGVERWLNENVAWEDMSFGWLDGEMFYMPSEWWAAEEGE